MSTRLVGRLLSETFDGAQSALAGCRVRVRNNGVLFAKQIGGGVTDSSGNFSVTYTADGSEPPRHRQLEIVVEDAVGRALPVVRAGGETVGNPDGRPTLTDVDDTVLDGGDFIVMEGDARGLLVTLGTGRADETRPPHPGEIDPPAATGKGLSQGNAVDLLIDFQAFTHIADKLVAAQSSILMSQLFFPVPKLPHPQPGNEKPVLVFKFASPPPTTAALRAISSADLRPERLLIDAASQRNVDVRIIVHEFEVPLFIRILAGIIVFPVLTIAGSLWVALDKLGDDLTHADELTRYFGLASPVPIKVRAFQQSPVSAGVMHAKLGVIDGTHAFCIGSPFGQSYVDPHDHSIEEPQRGDEGGLAKHDIGFAVTGPAVGDIRQNLRLLWNQAALDPDDRVADDPDPPANPPAATSGGDGVCSLQIVRTMTEDRFEGMPRGEKGILEGYLRAIGEAENFIYLETQYFTDDPIGRALTLAMTRRPDLQVIVLLNIRPDVPFYPFKQRRLITRIREAIGETANGARQFGVYTRWAHEPAPPPAPPRMAPVYVHAKIGIVDDKWATIGSANLDGLSLDSYMVSDVLNWLPGLFGAKPFDEQRAIEINGNMFNNVAGQPPSGIVDLLRRKLWAEHLTFLTPGGSLHLNAPQLTNIHVDGWLGLWRTRADATLQQLRTQPRMPLTNMARVLPWPDEDETFKTPRSHLHALKILPQMYAPLVTPLESTREFDFKTGAWGADAEVDG